MQIFTEQLLSGHTEKICLSLPADFLDVQEKELFFMNPVTIEGEAYATPTELIMHVQCRAKACMPCSICNQMTPVEIDTGPLYQSVSFADLPSALYDYSSWIREEIVLQVPQFAECGAGECPQRESIGTYLSKKPKSSQFPFSEL